jgi:ABC-type antimicrobial peptide transport system permease subunit
MDPQIPSHLRDRLARLRHDAHRAIAEILIELPSRLSHDPLSLKILAFPWPEMASYMALAALVGVIAAILPAIRAARINVLSAIAHE